MKILSYNLDYNLSGHIDRLKIFINQVKEINPDIIAIQEGSKEIYEELFRRLGRLDYKYNFPPEIRNKLLGELIFTKYKIIESNYVNFQYSKQNKGMNLCKIMVEGTPLIIISTQLDDDLNVRKKQFDQISRLDLTSNIIILADSRIKNYQDDPEFNWFCDAWEEEGCNTEKYTIDYTKNHWVQPECKDRFDRIWFTYASQPQKMECTKYNLVGIPDQPIDSGIGLASSHFGIVSIFEFCEQF